jgi:Protein of unknown function (DUF3375)
VKLPQIQAAFRSSPAISMLRSTNAAYVIDFLYAQFKQTHRLTISDPDLRAALEDYQRAIRQLDPEALPEKASIYLSDWTEKNYLTRFFQRGETGGDATFQLTSFSELVIQFLEGMITDEVGFVGTQSRIRLVMESLKGLVIQATADPHERITHLEAEKQRIQTEINSIKQQGVVARLGEVEIRERFGVIVEMMKQVQGDFRHVEESFKEITRELQRRQLGDADYGELVSYALAAEDELKNGDQGRSFEAFTHLIFSHQSQNEFSELIDKAQNLEELNSQRQGLKTLEKMPSLLLAEAQKVMETTQRLSRSLRLLLDEKASNDQRLIRKIMSEIRDLAADLSDSPPDDKAIGLTFDEASLPFRSPIFKEFFQVPREIEAQTFHVSEQDDQAQEKAFRRYAAMSRLDWDGMRASIQKLTQRGVQIPLRELLDRCPPKAGAVEVIGYIRLAKEGQHLIDQENEETIYLPDGKALTVPRVVFLPK